MVDCVGRFLWFVGFVFWFVNFVWFCFYWLIVKVVGYVIFRNGVFSMMKDEKEKIYVDVIIECYKDLMVEIFFVDW